MIQKPKLSEREKNKWLDRFRSTGGKPLLAFACLGSIFSEGIDLIGEQLIGVFVIGTGLPRPSPERELMRQYYEQEFGSGFHFAYTFPGFNRVMQAAGRLIRHEDDRGIIILIDDRYSREIIGKLSRLTGWRNLFMMMRNISLDHRIWDCQLI